MGKAWEHSSHEWTRGGRGQSDIQIYVLNLKASVLLVKMSSFHHAKSGVWKRSKALKWMVLCVVWQLAPPPYIHLASTWCHSRDEYSQPSLPRFNYSLIFWFHVLLWMQIENQNRGGLGPRLGLPSDKMVTQLGLLGTRRAWPRALLPPLSFLVVRAPCRGRKGKEEEGRRKNRRDGEERKEGKKEKGVKKWRNGRRKKEKQVEIHVHVHVMNF